MKKAIATVRRASRNFEVFLENDRKWRTTTTCVWGTTSGDENHEFVAKKILHLNLGKGLDKIFLWYKTCKWL